MVRSRDPSTAPANVKSPFQFCTGALARVTAAPLVLPRVPPAIVTLAPTRADASLTFMTPPFIARAKLAPDDAALRFAVPPATVTGPMPSAAAALALRLPALIVVPPA